MATRLASLATSLGQLNWSLTKCLKKLQSHMQQR